VQRGGRLLFYLPPLLQAPTEITEVTSKEFKGLTPLSFFFSLFTFFRRQTLKTRTLKNKWIYREN
jgi:hypothetical protein